ncbi:MAG: hypothetical protein ACTHLR_12875 [Rhizomicrobium sp.]
MAWWDRIFKRNVGPRLQGAEYRVAFNLYSEDGKREVEVREFRNGEIYLVEREWVEGTTFEDRHAGQMVGPFASPQAAEKFIVATAWFCGRDNVSE